MKLKSRDRMLVIDRRGITVEFHRPRYGGGTYVKNSLTWHWPWKKVS